MHLHLPDGTLELTNRGKRFALRTFKLANIYGEIFCKKLKEAKSSGKTKLFFMVKAM